MHSPIHRTKNQTWQQMNTEVFYVKLVFADHVNLILAI